LERGAIASQKSLVGGVESADSRSKAGHEWPTRRALAKGEVKMVRPVDSAMMARITNKPGFLAALDQSGGSTPGALRLYGVPDSDYSGDAEMFRIMHEMRVRIIVAPAFSGDKVIGAILFEATMDGEVLGQPVPGFLWKNRSVVPFLKVDKGLQSVADGVQMMKPIPDLDALLARATSLGVFGTKMRSVITAASRTGIDAIVAQQFELAGQIASHGLMPILEPEILLKTPDKADAEALLLTALMRGLDTFSEGQVMIKVAIPEIPDHYAPLISHARTARLLALSGGQSQSEACARLAANHGMIASFSRALIGDLKRGMSDVVFDQTLSRSIDAIYQASTQKL
jgi:fructose-bisphosphate aldolase class I